MSASNRSSVSSISVVLPRSDSVSSQRETSAAGESEQLQASPMSVDEKQVELPVKRSSKRSSLNSNSSSLPPVTDASSSSSSASYFTPAAMAASLARSTLATVAAAASPTPVAEEKDASTAVSRWRGDGESGTGTPDLSPHSSSNTSIVTVTPSRGSPSSSSTAVKRSPSASKVRNPTPSHSQARAASATRTRISSASPSSSASQAANLTAVGASSSSPAAAVINWQFPDSSAHTGVTPKKSQHGVFKQFFSPNAQNANSAYMVYNNAHGSSPSGNTVVPMVAAPMAEFRAAKSSPTLIKNKKIADQTAAKRRARETGTNVSPSRIRTNVTLGHSASAVTIPTGSGASPGSYSALGIAHATPSSSQTYAFTSSPSTQQQQQTSLYGNNNNNAFSEMSFARRMIHAASAAELTYTQPEEQLNYMSDDPHASSLYFEGRDPAGFAAAQQQQQKTKLQQAAEQSDEDVAAQEERDAQALVLYSPVSPLSANANNNYGSLSSNRWQNTPTSPYGVRPQTAGVSSSGIAWSSTLTAALNAEEKSPPAKVKRPTTSGASGRKLASSPNLPEELTIGLEVMPAHMQREHAALARLINNLEPAGKASLINGSVFNKLNNQSRGALFQKPNYDTSSQVTRLEQSSESDEFLRKRSMSKAIENQKQSSAAISSRGASGLAANNVSARDVALAVGKTHEQYDISDERPRASRPQTAAAGSRSFHVGVAAATAAAGSNAAAQIIDKVTSSTSPTRSRQQRPTTAGPAAAAARSHSSSRSVLRPSTASSTRTNDADILLPGFGAPPTAVLGFGGSIDRFGSAIDDFRFHNTLSSSVGGRGMLASKSANKLLAGIIPTDSEASNVPVNATGSAAAAAAGAGSTAAASAALQKKFASLALEFEVALTERLVRIPAGKGTSALERLDVFRTAFDSIIMHSPHFGALLAKIKAEYEAYARRGVGAPGQSGAGGGDASISSSPSNHQQNGEEEEEEDNKQNGGGRRANVSAAEWNQQQVEDTLVLENHRLHTKLHGFQRAYTSLYAKYKSLLHKQKIQEGILAQNALVLNDLNTQLQQAVLASMTEEERRLEHIRAAGFHMENHTREEALHVEAAKALKNRGTGLPQAVHDEEEALEEEEELNLLMGENTEEQRKAMHQRKIARMKARQAKAAAAAEGLSTTGVNPLDPLERGRQLMREYKGPPGSVLQASMVSTAAQNALAQLTASQNEEVTHDKDGNVVDVEGDPIMSPSNLSQLLERSAMSSPTAGGTSSGKPSLEIITSEQDPFDYMTTHSKREVDAYRQRVAQMEEDMLRLQTALDQSRAKELSALMAMEEVAKARYREEKAAKDAAAAAVKSASSAKGSRTNSKPASARSKRPSQSSASGMGESTVPSHQVPSHALLDNISAAASKRSSANYAVPALPLQHLAPGGTYGNQSPNQLEYDDEDPDDELAPDNAQQASDVDRTLAELRFHQQLSDSRIAMHEATTEEAESSLLKARASREAEIASHEVAASQQQLSRGSSGGWQ